MAITDIGVVSNASDNGGADVSIDLTVLGTLAQNDLVIVVGAIGDNDNVDFTMSMVTTGYTTVADLFANDTFDCNLGVFYKFMGATPDTTAVFNGQGGSDASVVATARAFRGVSLSNPLDVASATATGTNTGNAAVPNLAWSTAGTWIVMAAATGADIVTPDYVNMTSVTAIDTTDVIIGLDRVDAPPNPFIGFTATLNNADSTNDSWCAITLALRPANVTTYPGWYSNLGGWF